MLAKLIVTVFGVGLIILVNWYFLFSRKKAFQAELKERGIQEIKVVVKGGYSPDKIVVKKGIPVRLYFYRDETADCSDTIVFGDFKIRKALPAFKTTPIEFTPETGSHVIRSGDKKKEIDDFMNSIYRLIN